MEHEQSRGEEKEGGWCVGGGESDVRTLFWIGFAKVRFRFAARFYPQAVA